MDNSVKDRIRVLLNNIYTVMSDLQGKTMEQFAESDLLVRATCFSIVQVGEQMIQLEKKLKNNYPNIPWEESRKLRNLIVHIYHKVDADQIYDTAVTDLPPLKEEFLKIRNDLLKTTN